MGDRDKNIVISISGGRSSGMMARHIQTSDKYKDYNKLFVFANTGMERSSTIQFLRDSIEYWGMDIYVVEGKYSSVLGEGVGYTITDFDNLSMDATPFEGAIMHKSKGAFYGLPNTSAPYCSDAMRSIPIKKFSDDVFGRGNYVMAIGYRREDMPKRISWKEIELDKKRVYPLLTDFENPIGLMDLNRWWNKQDFKLSIHSDLGNCEMCWKKSDRKIVDDIRYGTRFIEWFDKMEKKYENTMFRGRKSIHDFVKMSKLPTTALIEFDDTDDGCVCNF